MGGGFGGVLPGTGVQTVCMMDLAYEKWKSLDVTSLCRHTASVGSGSSDPSNSSNPEEEPRGHKVPEDKRMVGGALRLCLTREWLPVPHGGLWTTSDIWLCPGGVRSWELTAERSERPQTAHLGLPLHPCFLFYLRNTDNLGPSGCLNT